MTTAPESRDFQTEVLDRLERLEQKLDTDIQRLDHKLDVNTQSLNQKLDANTQSLDERTEQLDANVQRLDERTEKWEERFLQLSRDVSRTVIIAAASVVILGSLLDKADVLVEGITRLLGK